MPPAQLGLGCRFFQLSVFASGRAVWCDAMFNSFAEASLTPDDRFQPLTERKAGPPPAPSPAALDVDTGTPAWQPDSLPEPRWPEPTHRAHRGRPCSCEIPAGPSPAPALPTGCSLRVLPKPKQREWVPGGNPRPTKAACLPGWAAASEEPAPPGPHVSQRGARPPRPGWARAAGLSHRPTSARIFGGHSRSLRPGSMFYNSFIGLS